MLELKDVDGEDFYTIKELEGMDNLTMAYMVNKFLNMRFRRNKAYKPNGQTSKFNRGNTSKTGESGTKCDYKTGLVDRSKFRCNELKHFSTECRKPKQSQKMDKGFGNQSNKKLM